MVFSDDWGAHPSSCQHLFRVLSRSHPTLWVNTVGMRVPRFTAEDARKAFKKVLAMLATARPGRQDGAGAGDGAVERPAGLTVCSPLMTPFERPEWLRLWNVRSVTRTVLRRVRDLDFKDFFVITTIPNVHDVVHRLGAAKVVYYSVDDFSEWPGMDKERILSMEHSLLRSVDRVICTSQALLERFEKDYRAFLLPHGVDLEPFMNAPPRIHPLLDAIPEPRVGYYGLLDGRADLELLQAVATRLPGVSFVFTGPVEGSFEALRRIPNVHFTGPVPYRDLPSIVHGWRACLLPYRMNELTRNLNPLKLREYLATGMPVLSTPIPEAQRFVPHVRLVTGVEEWTNAVEDAVSGRWVPRKAEILDLLRPHSWEEQASDFLRMCCESSSNVSTRKV
ncbi:MAG TPA: glycosyltransferase [Planctomycetota bacterium]|nr:glycosyltransferase [Planctomycetota bacterium]